MEVGRESIPVKAAMAMMEACDRSTIPIMCLMPRTAIADEAVLKQVGLLAEHGGGREQKCKLRSNTCSTMKASFLPHNILTSSISSSTS